MWSTAVASPRMLRGPGCASTASRASLRSCAHAPALTWHQPCLHAVTRTTNRHTEQRQVKASSSATGPRGSRGPRPSPYDGPRATESSSPYQRQHQHQQQPGGGAQGYQQGGSGGGGNGGGVERQKDIRLVLRQVGKLPEGVSAQDLLELKTGLAVTWLGTSSGNPTLTRNTSCTAVRAPGATYLVDCGEGSHRQLPTAGQDLASVHSIFITHLHGDHCYGLGAALVAVDGAKAAALAEAAEAGRAPDPAWLTDTRVYGPPGLAELVYAQVVLTGGVQTLSTRIWVTELVCTQAEVGSHGTPQPLLPTTDAVMLSRLAARSVDDVPALKKAAEAVAPRVAAIPATWRPPRDRVQYAAPPPLVVGNDGGMSDLFSGTAAGSASDDEAEMYSGRYWVAEPGLFWDLPSGPLRVVAAQLQHRVPCWGYVFQEAQAHEPGARRRKVVVLGDTCDSRAIAPLALGADLLAHEATFAEGMEDKCRVSQHSTGWMAGAFGAAVGARCLVLTHFSARYGKPPPPPKKGFRVKEESADEVLEAQGRAVMGLMAEARQYYRSGTLLAASDFYTVHVPLQPAPTAAAQ